MYEEDSEGNCVPIITLELMSDTSTESAPSSNEPQLNNDDTPQNSADNFSNEKLQEEKSECCKNRDKELEAAKESRVKTEGVEYVTRTDGSVVCKLCGEILQSRTHWYRHKYKLHVPPSLNPAPLFQCEQCLVYFKSRKGYIGHLANRHSEVLADSSPVLTNEQVEAMAKEQQQLQQQQLQQQQQQQQLQQQQLQQQQLQQQQVQQMQQDIYKRLHQDAKEELDPELAIPKSSVPNYQTTLLKPTPPKPPEQKKIHRNTRNVPAETAVSSPELNQKRIREEKLVSDIIDRVRRECEAQGSGGPARRGYNRRSTVTNP